MKRLSEVLKIVALVAVALAMVHSAPSRASGSPAQISVPSGTHVTAKYEDESDVKLNSQEQVALLFMIDITDIERDCYRTGKYCSLDSLVKSKKLNQDPNNDPNYTYVVTIKSDEYQAAAIPRKAGLGGFLYVHPHLYYNPLYYNPSGKATETSRLVTDFGYVGKSFRNQ